MERAPDNKNDTQRLGTASAPFIAQEIDPCTVHFYFAAQLSVAFVF
jgi:hypothetical protein